MKPWFEWLLHAHDHIWKDEGWPGEVRVECCRLLQNLWTINFVMGLNEAMKEKGNNGQA